MIYAIDHSASALRQAMSDLGERRDAVVKYVQAEVQNLSQVLGERVDSVVFFNAIHYVPDKASLLRQVREALKPGGTFVFNSAFYEGAHLPETDEFARRWMMRSLRILRRDFGLRPVRTEKVEARHQLSPGDYEELLAREGFEVAGEEIRRIDVPIDGWYDISGFKDFIEGVMPGVPLDKGSEALQRGCREIFEEFHLKFVPRNWMLVVARRPV